MVTQRHQAAPVVVAGEVEHDRAQVRRRPIRRFDAPGVASQPEERLLHEVLGRVPVVDEQPGQSDQRAPLRLEQRDDEALGVRTPYAVAQQVRGRIHSPHHLDGRVKPAIG